MSVSAIATTLAVNPAFLEEIKDSNATLWSQLERLRETCASHELRPPMLHRLVDLLNEVRDLLALQFALEESYGYIELPAVSPSTSATASVATAGSSVRYDSPSSPTAKSISSASATPRTAEQIRAQHCPLYLQASELAEKAEELQYRGWVAHEAAQLVNKVKQFDLQLQDHERAERQLLDATRRGTRGRR